MKNQFGVGKLFELNLDDLPKSRRGIELLVVRENWEYVEVPSRGKGGVRREYILPDDLFEQAKAKLLKNMADSVELPATIEKKEVVTVEAVNPLLLADWQRDCGS